MSISRSSLVRSKTKDYSYTKRGDVSNYAHETHGCIKSSWPSSPKLYIGSNISTTLALKYILLKNSLENDVIAGRILILSSSLLVLLTTLVTWLWLYTIVSKRLYSMKTLRITNLPLSKFHIYGTNNFLSLNQLRLVCEALSF